MTSIPLPAAAACGSSVTVEDESPILKRCCGCSADRPESDFSGAQLKKKGKRVCKECVEQREWAEAKAADDAAAAKSAARPSRTGASSHPAAAAATPPSAAAVCIVCGKGAAKLRACSRCRSLCCGAVCLKLHSMGDTNQCTAVRSLPPLSIADEDRITVEEIELHWLRLQRRMLSLLPDDPIFTFNRERLAELKPADIATLVQVYPPTPSLPWWTSASAGFAEFLASMRICFATILLALRMTNAAYAFAVIFFRVDTTRPTVLDNLLHDKFFPHVPPSLDESRLFHRLLRYLIYYYRHVDPSFIDPQLRPFVDVRSDDDGVLPGWVDPEDRTHLCLVAYCTHADPSGRRTLLPIHVRFLKDKKRALSRGISLLQQGGRVVIWDHGARVDEPGLVIHVRDDGTHVTACTGRTSDPTTSWCLAPAVMGYARASVYQEPLRNPACSLPFKEELRSLLEARSRPDYFHLVPAMHEALKDDWPDPEKSGPGQEALLFVAVPRSGLESDLAELLLLESLAEEAAAGDPHSVELIAHIESECGATIGEVIAAQRSRVERMMADQRDQMRIHAEAVQRHDQRGIMRQEAAGGDGDGSSSVRSGGSSQSASVLTSVAQLGRSVGGLALSSTSASPSSPSVALNCSSASSSTGALSSDRAASAVAESTASAASAAASCSWTAAHRSLESLRAPGRKKYGPILKAALRFLHSLQPVSVNRGGGSHTVFHFARGEPVTLVQPHAGGRSKDGTVGAGYCTRLYQSLHSVALQQLQLGGGESAPVDAPPSSRSSPKQISTPSSSCSN